MSSSINNPAATITILAAVAPVNDSTIPNLKIGFANPPEFKKSHHDWAWLEKYTIQTTAEKLQLKEGYESRLCKHLKQEPLNSRGDRNCWTGECYIMFYDQHQVEFGIHPSMSPWHGGGDATKQAEIDKMDMGECLTKGRKLYFLGEGPGPIWKEPTQKYYRDNNKPVPEGSLTSHNGFWVDRSGGA